MLHVIIHLTPLCNCQLSTDRQYKSPGIWCHMLNSLNQLFKNNLNISEQLNTAHSHRRAQAFLPGFYIWAAKEYVKVLEPGIIFCFRYVYIFRVCLLFHLSVQLQIAAFNNGHTLRSYGVPIFHCLWVDITRESPFFINSPIFRCPLSSFSPVDYFCC